MTLQETPPILDLEALRASAAKFREMQEALEARRRSLDELESRLEAEHINLGGKIMAIGSVRAALRRDREKVEQARVALERDSAALQADRLESANEQRRLQELVPVLEERDRLLREVEDRLKRRIDELTGQAQKSEARLRRLAERDQVVAQRERDLQDRVTRLTAMGEMILLHEKKLAEREAEFTRHQSERLAALEVREQQSASFCDAITAMAAEAAQRTASYAAMKGVIREEIDAIAVARESAVAEAEWLREAQAILTGTVESDGADSEAELSSGSPAPSTEPMIGDPAAALFGPHEALPTPVDPESEPVTGTETAPATTKAGAVGVLAEAIEAWERARAAGGNVLGLRGPARSAREALASGDYDGAMRLATTILTRIRASSSAP